MSGGRVASASKSVQEVLLSNEWLLDEVILKVMASVTTVHHGTLFLKSSVMAVMDYLETHYMPFCRNRVIICTKRYFVFWKLSVFTNCTVTLIELQS